MTRARRCQPWRREPDGRTEPRAERDDDVPGRDEAELAGSDHDPGEERNEAPHPRDEEAPRDARDRGEHEHRPRRAPTSTETWRTSAATTSSAAVATTLTRASVRCRKPSRRARSAENIAVRSSRLPPASVFSTKSPFARRPQQAHGPKRSSGRVSQSGVVIAVPIGSATAPAIATSTVRHRRDHRHTDEGRDDVADDRMRVVVEAVSVEERVMPEAGVVGQAVRHRLQVVLVEIQIGGCVLAERAPVREQPERREQRTDGEDGERDAPRPPMPPRRLGVAARVRGVVVRDTSR